MSEQTETEERKLPVWIKDSDTRHARAEHHATDPQGGDYWHDMFVPVCVVVDRIGKSNVLICKKTKDVENDRWTWDLDNLEVMKIEEFKDWLKYGSIPGYWADVAPGSHFWVVDAVAACMG